MGDSKSIDSLELSPIKQESPFEDLEVLCHVISQMIKRYGSESMAFAAIDINGESGGGIGLTEFSYELVNQGFVDENEVEKIERIFNQLDNDRDGVISREDWQTAFETYPTRLGNIEAQQESRNSDIDNIGEPPQMIDEMKVILTREIVSRNNSNSPSKRFCEISERINNSPGLDGLMRKCNALKASSSSSSSQQNYNKNQSLERRSQLGLLVPSAHILQVNSEQVASIFGDDFKTPSKEFASRQPSTHQNHKQQEQMDSNDHLNQASPPVEVGKNEVVQLQSQPNSLVSLKPVESNQGSAKLKDIFSQQEQHNYEQQSLDTQNQRLVLSKKIEIVGSVQQERNQQHVSKGFMNFRSTSPQIGESSSLFSPLIQTQMLSSNININSNKNPSNQNGFTLSNHGFLNEPNMQKQPSSKNMKSHFESYLSVIGLGNQRSSNPSQKYEHASSGLSPLLYRVSSSERQSKGSFSIKTPSQFVQSPLSNLTQNKRAGLETIIDKINSKKGNLLQKNQNGTNSTQALPNIIQLHKMKQTKSPEVEGSLEKFRILSTMQRATITSMKPFESPDSKINIQSPGFLRGNFQTHSLLHPNPVQSVMYSSQNGQIGQKSQTISTHGFGISQHIPQKMSMNQSRTSPFRATASKQTPQQSEPFLNFRANELEKKPIEQQISEKNS